MPSRNNEGWADGSWKGVFYVDQWSNTVNIKLDISFDTPVFIETNPRVVHLIDLKGNAEENNDSSVGMKSFRLTTVQPPSSINRIEFKVLGLNGKFPNVRSMTVNGVSLCDNKDRLTNVEIIQGLLDGNTSSTADSVANTCGLRHPVVADTKEEVIDWPWKISLWTKDSDSGEWTLSCGGTLISLNTVLTGEFLNCLLGVHQSI